ncbi:hypothetical protein [Nitrosomonas supralitoralis]|uniref:Uncharacterized protein n=1 Tax=Nitrosomonas supralitoralis TaxID=2116706 RepID=A0A2P7NQX0_9PROT|nr:hypothetical protein [Nitrosomonas supralitoralis]PSJ15863.1 hypothetical protein C7H79_16710 [Nitrosomonas supralitoralis]
MSQHLIPRASKLRYIEGQKYRSVESFWAMCNLRPHREINLHNINLTRDGMFYLTPGYSSDGPSGPTIDTRDFMPGAMGWHDPCYELLRYEMMHIEVDIIQPPSRPGEGVIYHTKPEDKIIRNASHEQIREEVDKFLADILLLDNMWRFRARYVYEGVRKGGLSSASVCTKVYAAP